MPPLGKTDVPHISQTDHRIPRRPRPAGESAAGGATDPPRAVPLVVFQEEGFQPPDVELQRAHGIYLAEYSEREQDQSVAREAIESVTPLLHAGSRDAHALIAGGRALVLLGEIEPARRLWSQVLSFQPRNEEALDLSSIMSHSSGDLHRARREYEQLLDVNSTRSDYFARYAHVLGQLRDYDAGIEAAHRALELNPSLVPLHAWLAEVYRLQGNIALARDHTAIVERFQARR
jgi:tetratricopeptide (TPR) repeat protein